MSEGMKRGALALIVCVVSVWIAAGCATINVSSYAERGTDLRQYRTYRWGSPERGSTGDPRLDSNRFFDERVRAQVDGQLARRGFEQTTGQPDLLVRYHARVSQEIDVRERDDSYCADHDCRPAIYDGQTLLVYFVEPRTDRLVWRGWAQGDIDGVVDNQALMESWIDEAIAKIFARLPAGMTRNQPVRPR